MKVLRVSPHYYFESKDWPSEYDPLGGMQTQITYLTEKLAERNVTQIVITSGYPGAEEIHQKNYHVIPVSNFCIRIKSKIDGILGFGVFWSLGLWNWIIHNKQTVKDFDIIHFHYSGVFAPIFASFVMSQFFSTEQVITIHCSRNFTFIPPNLYSRLVNVVIKKLELKTIKKAKKIIVLTEKQKDNYVAIGVDVNKIEVIGDCIPEYHLVKQKSIDEPWRKVLQSNKKTIVFVGRISFEKGCERLIQIAEGLKRDDITFLIVGDGPYKEELLQEIKKKKLEDIFTVTGFVSKLKIPYILQNADILLIPSIHEEFGGVVLEGVAAGVPIVTSGVGGISKVLGDTYNGIVGDNIEQFCRMVNAYLDGEKSPNYNRDEIIRKYNFNDCLDRLCKIYEE